MANFSSGIDPVTPSNVPGIVVPASSATADAIRSVANIGGAVGGSIVRGQEVAQAAQITNRQNQYMSDFIQNHARIAQLEARGDVKPDYAAGQYRLMLARAVANHPEMAQDFLKTQKAIVDDPTLGGNVAKDVQQEKDNQNDLQMQSIKAAQAVGWGSPDMPTDQQQLWADKHQQFLFAQSQIDASNAVMAHKKAENELTTSGLAITSARQNIVSNNLTIQKQRMDNAQALSEQQFTAGIKSLSDAYYPKFTKDLSTLVSNVQSGKMTKENAISAAQTQLAGIQQQVSGLAMAHKDPTYITSFMAPYQMLFQNTVDQVSGKTLNTVATNEVSNIQALHESQLLTSDPEIAKLAAISNVFKTGLGPLGQVIQGVAGNILKNSIGPAPDPNVPPNIVSDGTPQSTAGVKQALDINKRAMVTEPTANSPPLTDELKNSVLQHFRGLTMYGPTASSPTQLNEAVKYFASPEFGAYVKAHPGIMTGDVANKAEGVYRKQYQDQVLPLIQKEFMDTSANISTAYTMTGSHIDQSGGLAAKTGGIPVTDTAPTSDLVQPYFNGVGVSFKIRTVDDNGQPLSVTHPEWVNSPTVKDKIAQLNRDVAPVMNILIRANSHFASNTKYGQAYDALINELGWDYGQKPITQ